MKHVYVKETDSDSVTYIESNDVNILLFDRRDFANIQDLATNQGIYILYNDETVYVGQSSHTDGVITRLRRHHTSKMWWTRCIVIFPHQIMTKAHYDYIERTLILTMKQHGNTMDNRNEGNTSPITNIEQTQCEFFLRDVNTLLSDTFHIDLYRLTTKTYIQHLEKTVQQLLDGTLEDYDD